MPDIDDVTIRLRVVDDATTPLQRVKVNATEATASLRGMGTADPILASLGGGLDKLAASAERASATLDQLSRTAALSTGALTTTAAATDGLSRQMGTLDGTLNRASSSLLGFFGTATKYGVAAFGAMTAAAGYFGVTTAASFQQTQASFSTLLGSLTAGQQMFKQLQAFNLQTPFGLPELTRSEQTLLQYGMSGSQSFDVLKTLSNVAAVGTDPANDLQRSALALGQISSAGVVRGQDINQLTQAGFPIIRLLQQVTGQSGAQLQQQIQGGGLTLPAGDLISAIASGGGSVLAPYAGAARAQSQTVSGQFSNFKDTLRSDLAGASSPLSAQLQQTLPQLTAATHELLTVAGPPMFALLGDLLHGFTGLLPVLQPVLTGLSAGLHDFVSALGPGAKDLVPVGQELGNAFHELFTDLAGHGDELSKLMVDLVGILPDMVHLLDDLVPLVGLLAEGLDSLLQFGPVQHLAAGLLVTLLGYKALSGVIKVVDGLALAVRGLAVAEIEEAAAANLPHNPRTPGPGGGKTLLGGLAAMIGGGLVMDALGRNTANEGTAGFLGTWGETVAGGALAGSMFGPPGALVGGAAGVILGSGKAFWDQHQANHPDPSTVWDPSRPGYGGYPGGATDNSVKVDTINVINPTSDADIQRALADFQNDRARRK